MTLRRETLLAATLFVVACVEPRENLPDAGRDAAGGGAKDAMDSADRPFDSAEVPDEKADGALDSPSEPAADIEGAKEDGNASDVRIDAPIEAGPDVSCGVAGKPCCEGEQQGCKNNCGKTGTQTCHAGAFGACSVANSPCCSDQDCGACKKCVNNACQNEMNEDVKNDCGDGVCRTGLCNGNGGCGFTANGMQGPGCQDGCKQCDGAGKCNDTSVTCLVDADSDGYGDDRKPRTTRCGSCPRGEAKDRGAGMNDCYDANASVYPGADFPSTGYSSGPEGRGDGSNDYNCDGKVEFEGGAWYYGCDAACMPQVYMASCVDNVLTCADSCCAHICFRDQPTTACSWDSGHTVCMQGADTSKFLRCR